MEYIRNRKTVQIILENRKTETYFDQKRKPQAKSEKTHTRLRSLRRMFSAKRNQKNTKQHRIADTKTRCSFSRKPKTESEIEQKPQTAIATKTENPKSFWYKNRKTDLKMDRNRKTENPNTPRNSLASQRKTSRLARIYCGNHRSLKHVK